MPSGQLIWVVGRMNGGVKVLTPVAEAALLWMDSGSIQWKFDMTLARSFKRHQGIE